MRLGGQIRAHVSSARKEIGHFTGIKSAYGVTLERVSNNGLCLPDRGQTRNSSPQPVRVPHGEGHTR